MGDLFVFGWGGASALFEIVTEMCNFSTRQRFLGLGEFSMLFLELGNYPLRAEPRRRLRGAVG
jgi:hypothetical protein